MLTQTPGENTRPRTGRPHDKNRLVYVIMHFSSSIGYPQNERQAESLVPKNLTTIDLRRAYAWRPAVTY